MPLSKHNSNSFNIFVFWTGQTFDWTQKTGNGSFGLGFFKVHQMFWENLQYSKSFKVLAKKAIPNKRFVKWYQHLFSCKPKPSIARHFFYSFTFFNFQFSRSPYFPLARKINLKNARSSKKWTASNTQHYVPTTNWPHFGCPTPATNFAEMRRGSLMRE